jgi:hypothetical protein
MKTMNLDEFADYKVDAIVNTNGEVIILFGHYNGTCNYREEIKDSDTFPTPLKFLIVKATEHWMECSKDE